MSATYSPSLRIELITTGTENEAWGTPTDNNIGTIIEQAITGVNSISLTNLTSLTLSTANAAVDEARNAVLVFTGTPTANCNVVAPSVNKVYIVSNETTGGFNINMKASSDDLLVIPPGSKQLIFCNGTAFSTVVSPNAINSNLNITGSATIGGNVTTGGNIVLGSTITNTTGNLSLVSQSNIVSFQASTGALAIPSGTTGQRPTNKALGMQRWNSDIGVVEVWNGSIWVPITGATQGVFLVVAGGGGGGWGSFSAAGGGGAGGLLTGTFYANVSTSYSIVVGAGGTGGAGLNATNGTDSTAFSVTAIGGGCGGYTTGYGVGSGGSGGGGANGEQRGSGTSGQGYRGGYGRGDPFRGGGGGGASAVGGDGNSGTGGDGIQSSITGTPTYYAGGGGGGGCNAGGGQDATLPGAGGLGGGGIGGYGGPDGSGSVPTNGAAGTANTGGGGGGGARVGQYGVTQGGNGGSGVVIAAYASSYQKATGGTITTYTTGGVQYYVHTFTSSGTLAF